MTNDTPPPSARVRTFIETTLLHGRTIAPDEELLLSGLLDSLAVMSLVAEVERVTGQRVPPTDIVIENFSTLQAIAAYMAQRDSS